MNYTISNIKASLKIVKCNLELLQLSCQKRGIPAKKYPNFLVIHDNHKYTIFKKGAGKGQHINITKIKSFEDIHTALFRLNDLLATRFAVGDMIIDNITATSNLGKKIDLCSFLRAHSSLNIAYNAESFPGAFIRFSCATVILFSSGKLVIVGAKSCKAVEQTLEEICVCMQTL